MPRDVQRGLRVSSALLLLAGYFALATSPAYPGIIVSVPIALLLLAPLGEWLDERFTAYRRTTSWLSVIYLIFSFGLLPALGLLPVLTGFIIFIQAHTMLHRKDIRNYQYLFLMSFFLLLASTVQSPEPAIGLVMLLYLASGVMSLMFLQLYAELTLVSAGRSADIVPLDAEDTLVLTAPAKILDRGLIGVLGTLTLMAIGITVGLFALTPRMEAGLFGRESRTLARTGLSSRVDLARSGTIALDFRAVMRAEFPDEPEGVYGGPLYWRVTTLDDYKDSHWERRGLTQKSPAEYLALDLRNATGLPEGRLAAVRRPPYGNGRRVRQVIYLDTIPEGGIPALPLVQYVECTGAARGTSLSWDGQGDFTVSMTARLQQRLNYEAVSEIPRVDPGTLRAASDDYWKFVHSRDHKTLTHHNLLDHTVRLAEEITANAATVFDKAVAINDYFNSSEYSYTLDLPPIPAQHPIDAFINDTKVGHCQLYATAMALMLRSLGIPTRVVSGYRGGEWSRRERAYTVRASMAHLWVEVYFIDEGWVTFDPTPETAGGWLAQSSFMRWMTRQNLRLKMVWYRDVVGFDRGLQLRSLGRFLGRVAGFSAGMLAWPEVTRRVGLPAWTALVTVATLGMGCLLLLAYALSRWRDRYILRASLTVDQARAVRLYERLRKRLRRAGIVWADASGVKTAEELGRDLRLDTHGLDNIQTAHEVLVTYNEARFGGRPLPGARYAELLRDLRRLRAQDK